MAGLTGAADGDPQSAGCHQLSTADMFHCFDKLRWVRDYGPNAAYETVPATLDPAGTSAAMRGTAIDWTRAGAIPRDTRHHLGKAAGGRDRDDEDERKTFFQPSGDVGVDRSRGWRNRSAADAGAGDPPALPCRLSEPLCQRPTGRHFCAGMPPQQSQQPFLRLSERGQRRGWRERGNFARGATEQRSPTFVSTTAGTSRAGNDDAAVLWCRFPRIMPRRRTRRRAGTHLPGGSS
jgi:hypothetical protein